MHTRRALLLLLLALACASEPPDPAQAFLREGEAALAEGNAEQAIAAYQLALAVAPRESRALRGLLTAQVAAGAAEPALATLAEIGSAPGDPVDPCPALALAAGARLQRGHAAAAEDVERQRLDASCEGAREGRARVLAVRAESDAAVDPGTALDRYRESLALHSGSPERFVATARLMVVEGQVEDAVILLGNGLEQHPESQILRDLMVRVLSIR